MQIRQNIELEFTDSFDTEIATYDVNYIATYEVELTQINGKLSKDYEYTLIGTEILGTEPEVEAHFEMDSLRYSVYYYEIGLDRTEFLDNEIFDME